MTYPIKCIVAMATLMLSCASLFAQTNAVSMKKAEMLREILKEKKRADYKGSDDAERTAAKTTATDIKVTPVASGGREAEIAVAYNPNDSNKMVISFIRTGSTGMSFPIYYSSNGGATWTQSSFNSVTYLTADFPGQGQVGGGDPAFAWDKTGRLYFAWIYLSSPGVSSDSGYFTLNWAYSDDEGHTWAVKPNHFIGEGIINMASGDIVPYKDGVADREWLAVDNTTGPYQGNVYCSYVCFPAGTAPNFQGIKVLEAGIDTFGTVVPAYYGFSQFGNVAVDNSGKLHLSFYTSDVSDIKHVVSADGGATFGVTVQVSPVVNGEPTSFILHNRENAAPNMALDGPTGTGNNVHIVWSDYTTTATSYYSRSTDGGTTWSTPLDLNTFFGGSATEMPTVAAYGNNVSISLTAVEDMPGASNYYMLNSFNNGSTFDSTPALLSSAPTDYSGMGAPSSSSTLFFGDYTQSLRAKCMVYSAWTDGRSGTPKVYFARYNSCAPPTTTKVQDVTLVNDDFQLVSTFPNPAKDNLKLQIQAGKPATFAIQLVDMAGKVVFENKYVVKKGQQQLSVPVATLASGTYTVKVSENGALIASRTIVAGR